MRPPDKSLPRVAPGEAARGLEFYSPRINEPLVKAPGYRTPVLNYICGPASGGHAPKFWGAAEFAAGIDVSAGGINCPGLLAVFS